MVFWRLVKPITILLLIFSIVSAQVHLKEVTACVIKIMDSLISTLAVLLVVLAAVFYMAGNFFGAETKAKAQGYAMACIVGAIIAFLIIGIGPGLLKMMYGGGTVDVWAQAKGMSTPGCPGFG